jgi:transketolase
MRTAFIEGLIARARQDERIVLMVGDLGYSVIEPFQDEFPDRFFNAGIAEQNMMGMAAGLASEGFRVFAYSIANFPTFRCAEQVRNDIAYHGLPVTIVSVGGGLVYGNMGYSHHAVQDYALMRVLPGMQILAPGDPREVGLCLDLSLGYPGPSYLRLGNPGTPQIHTGVPEGTPGSWIHVAGDEKSTHVLLTTGGTLALATTWLDLPEYADYALYSLPCWGMGAHGETVRNVRERERVVTLEDHLSDAGFGSWVLESLSRVDPAQCSKLTIKALSSDVANLVAKEDTLRRAGGLVPE